MTLPQGYILHCHDELGSTNDEAKRLAREGSPDGTIVRARRQTAGRGRQGNSWVSSEGNLFTSFVIRPHVPMAEATQLSFVAAVALADAAGEAAQLKWPNDLLLDGRKAAGILLEAEGGFVVIGIGVNLAAAPEGAARIEGVSAEDMLEKLAARFDFWRGKWREEGFAPVRARWLQSARGLGGPVTARLPSGSIGGIFEDLDQTGALVLRLPDGQARTVTSGEVYAA